MRGEEVVSVYEYGQLIPLSFAVSMQLEIYTVVGVGLELKWRVLS